MADESNTKLHFGVFVPQIYSWEQHLAHARLVEALGFESLWHADQFANPFLPSTDWLEAWTLLGGLAAATSRVRLGPLVTHVVYRNPAVLARQILTLDCISGGRAEVAIGAGGTGTDFRMTGVAPQEPRELADRFIEGVELIDRLLCNRVSSYEGQYYRAEEVQMHPAPVQQPRPPLTIAAHGPRTLRLAARLGDTWNFYWIGPDATPDQCLEITAQRNRLITEYAESYGRDPASIKRSVTMGYTSEEPFASVEAFRDFVGRYREVGINEFVLGYVPDVPEGESGSLRLTGRWIMTQELLEQVADEISRF